MKSRASDHIEAPWTDDQVASLNGYQQRGGMHEFTCARASRPLIATPNGWVCPDCDYTQIWAYRFMTDWEWKAYLEAGPFRAPEHHHSRECPHVTGDSFGEP